jgi:MFS family permease
VPAIHLNLTRKKKQQAIMPATSLKNAHSSPSEPPSTTPQPTSEKCNALQSPKSLHHRLQTILQSPQLPATLAASTILFLTMGIRSLLGLFNVPIENELRWGRSIFSLAIAVLQLTWGFMQPWLCAWADGNYDESCNERGNVYGYDAYGCVKKTKKNKWYTSFLMKGWGATPVVMLGGVVSAVGFAVAANAGAVMQNVGIGAEATNTTTSTRVVGNPFITPPVLVVALGVLVGIGSAASALSIVLGALGKSLDSHRQHVETDTDSDTNAYTNTHANEKTDTETDNTTSTDTANNVTASSNSRRLIIFGIVSSAAQLGQFVLAPIVQVIITTPNLGWRGAMYILSGLCLLLLPLAPLLRPTRRASNHSRDRGALNLTKEDTFDTLNSLESEIKNERGNACENDLRTDGEGFKVQEKGKNTTEDLQLQQDEPWKVSRSSNASTSSSSQDTTCTLNSLSTTTNPSTHPTPVSQPNTTQKSSTFRTLLQIIIQPRFILLTSSFLTCGFHIGFISTHLPSYSLSILHTSSSVSSWTLSLIGLTSTLGTAVVGYLPKWLNVKVGKVLSTVYFLRGLLVIAFLVGVETLRSKNDGFVDVQGGTGGGVGVDVLVLMFSGLFGLFYLMTVPLTTAILSNM